MIHDLEEDLVTLGFTPTWEAEAPETYERLVAVLDTTSELGRANVTDTSDGAYEDLLYTAFGKAVSGMLSKTITFKNAGLRCCQNTEPFLHQTLFAPHNDDYAYYRKGPLALITDQDEVVAIQKNLGDPSVYPIANRPEIGLYVGTIAAAHARIRPSHIEDITDTVLVPTYMYEYFHPKRMAMTAVDRSIRKRLANQDQEYGLYYGLHPFERRGLLLSHAAIVERVPDLIEDAALFNPSWMLLPE